MRQQECKSEAICSKVDDELDLTLALGLPNHVRGKNVSNITQPQKTTQLICSQQAMQKLNFSHDQVHDYTFIHILSISISHVLNYMVIYNLKALLFFL